MNALTIQGLQKVYKNGVQALKGVDLAIPEGDFFALLGPNGAGKTTLIGIVVGLVNKSGGTVKVFEDDIDISPERARTHIGIVPQEFNFNIFENVFDIVVNQAGYYGIPRAQAVKDAEHYLRELGLWEKRNDPSRTLSGGMKRRLMIARALIHHPKVLILDEPTAGVDIELRRSMWDFLKKLAKSGITIVLTTHYLEEAEQLCKNVAIINKGEIIESGPMRDLLEKLKQETFVLYLANPISEQVLSVFEKYNPHLVDPRTLELSLMENDTIHDVVKLCDSTGIAIKTLRNKTNRLEEIFVNLINTHSNG